MKGAPPATEVEGESEVMVGGAAVTTKLMAVELAPPETVIGKLPALVKSVAEIWATSELLLMKVVGRDIWIS